MKKLNKKTIIYILIIICIISIYYFITKDEEYIGNIDIITEEKNEENTLLNEENTEDKAKEKIIVHISGAVKKQGVYEIEKGKRIADIIECAGGLDEDANIKNINLAYVLEDGMKIHIPLINENINEIQDNTNECISRDSKNTENEGNSKEMININTATQTELETLPGIGPSIALNIINYRKDNGKFNSIEDLKQVSGIGESKYSKIKDLIKI